MGTMHHISASVGRNGRNNSADVLVVQRLLVSSVARFGPLPRLAANGVCGPDTIEAIVLFQRNAVKMPLPDGRIDPGGRTLSKLVQYAAGPAAAHAGARAMDISEAGLKLIGRYEGLVLELYDDDVGFATIGYGHLVHRGKVGTNAAAEAPFAKGLTETEALALLRKDAAKHVAAVRSAVRVPLLQHQFDALVSFSFNVGDGGMKSSTLVRIINEGTATPEQIRAAFAMWNKAGGKENKGLANRRADEATVYNTGKY